jgi:hypothetical protein
MLVRPVHVGYSFISQIKAARSTVGPCLHLLVCAQIYLAKDPVGLAFLNTKHRCYEAKFL